MFDLGDPALPGSRADPSAAFHFLAVRRMLWKPSLNGHSSLGKDTDLPMEPTTDFWLQPAEHDWRPRPT